MEMKGGARMSENTNRRYQDFAKYDAMTTEELEEILRLDLDAPQEQESDTEVLLHIMELLAQRRKNDTVRSEKTALEAFESFQQNYMPKDIHTATCNRKRKTNSRKHSRWLRTLAATAALVAVVFLGSVTAKAFGLDIWKAVVQWTEDTFHISIRDPKDTEGPGKNDNLPYASLEEALKKVEVDTKLVPTWFPAGFCISKIIVDDTPLQKEYNAIYRNGDLTIKITIRHYLHTDPKYIEQSEGLVETYKVSNISYYLFSNNVKTQAVWINGPFECHIIGNLTIYELKAMIDSIEKG
jgi:hypothetical protein